MTRTSSPVRLVNGGNIISFPAGTIFPVSDPDLEISLGNVDGQSPVNKFGRSMNVDDGVQTDIWDRANVTNNQPIWLAPIAPRIHTIASSSVNDATGGTGANSVEIFYLLNWKAPETSEVVIGDLNSGIAMSSPAVVIHRMRIIPQATSTIINDGTITATAAVDNTVTAQIDPGMGQTQMAIYAAPSIQSINVTRFYGSVLKANAGNAAIDLSLLFNPSPNINPNVWLVQPTLGIPSNGSNPFSHSYKPYNKFNGPCILKLQAMGSANNLDVSAGLDGVLVAN